MQKHYAQVWYIEKRNHMRDQWARCDPEMLGNMSLGVLVGFSGLIPDLDYQLIVANRGQTPGGFPQYLQRTLEEYHNAHFDEQRHHANSVIVRAIYEFDLFQQHPPRGMQCFARNEIETLDRMMRELEMIPFGDSPTYYSNY